MRAAAFIRIAEADAARVAGAAPLASGQSDRACRCPCPPPLRHISTDRLFLDDQMQYSCANFCDPEHETLEQAQHSATLVVVIRATDVTERRTAGLQLVRLRARKLDHFGPLLGFFSKVPAKIATRARQCRGTEISNPSLNSWIGESSVDFRIELVEDFY
jgi:hypothetical protein